MILPSILFLVVFIVLSLLRTRIEGTITNNKKDLLIQRDISNFFLVTGTLIIVAYLLILYGFASTATNDFCSYGVALLSATSASLAVGIIIRSPVY